MSLSWSFLSMVSFGKTFVSAPISRLTVLHTSVSIRAAIQSIGTVVSAFTTWAITALRRSTEKPSPDNSHQPHRTTVQ